MTEIYIDEEIREKISERIKDTHFQSVEEYVNFVLREVINDTNSQGELSADNDNDLQSQLEDLGYL